MRFFRLIALLIFGVALSGNAIAAYNPEVTGLQFQSPGTVTGNPIFSGSVIFQDNISVTGTVTINGETITFPGVSANLLFKSGVFVNGDCLMASGTAGAIADAGAPCGSGGGGSGTVSAGTANELAYYASNGTTVSGITTANNGVLVTGASGIPAISTTLPSGLTIPSVILTSPNLGTPSVAVLTNATGLPISGISGFGTGVASALANAVTGSGGIVETNSPTVSGLTVTGSLTATGLITNANLVHPSTTVNGQTCTLGSTCSIPIGLTVGSTSILSGTPGDIEFNDGGTLGEKSITGSGSVVLATSPSISGLTVTSSLTAIGLITNSDLVNSSTTVNGQTCALGSTCSIAGTLTIGTTTIGGSPTSGYLLSVNGSTLSDTSPVGVAGVIDAQTLYGVKCDGTTDDTTHINNALAAAGSGPSRTVVMPAGVCIVSGTLLIGSSGVQFIGQGGPYGSAAAGPGTTIKTSVANGDVLDIGSTAGNVSGTLVQGFMFLSSVTRTGGDAIHRYAGTWNVMRNVYAYKMYVGYQIDGSTEPSGSGNADYDNFLYTSSFNSNSEAGIIIGAFGSTTTNGAALADFFTDVDASVNGSMSTSDHITGGIIVQNCGGCYFTNVTGIENTNGMSFVPASNEAATVFVTDMGWDSSLNAGLSFVATGTGTVGGQFAGIWFSSSGTAVGFINTNAVGIYFDSPQSAYGETSFTGGNIYNNAANGVVEASATQLIGFFGVNISNNSSLTSNAFDNYGMDSNTVHFTASGGYWGGAGGLTNQVRYALNLPGTGNDYITFDNIDVSGVLSSGSACTFGIVVISNGVNCATIAGIHSNAVGVIGVTDNHVVNYPSTIDAGHIATYAANGVPEIVDSGIDISGSAVMPPDNTFSMGASSFRWTSVWAVNGTIQTSDGRLKTDITPEPLGLDFIRRLKPVEYQWKDGKSPGVHHGLIAQDVQQALGGAPFAGLVQPADAKGYYGLNYEEMTAPLIKSVQQLDMEVALLWRILVTVSILSGIVILLLCGHRAMRR